MNKPLAYSYTSDRQARIAWYWDEHYSPFGSFAYDTEAETKAAERAEIDALDRGDLFPYGGVIEMRADYCACPECNNWHTGDSCWGIVYEPGAFEAMARDTFGIEIKETEET